jgi:hypothetical protein
MTRKGQHHTEVAKAKMSIALLGKRCSMSSEFKKGNISWNTGLKGKGICKANSGSFKKGNKPANSRGGIKICDDGFYIKTGVKDKLYKNGEGKMVEVYKYERLARVKYREAFGDFDDKLIVFHKDKDVFNDDINNLELITRGELLRRNAIRQAVCVICKKQFMKIRGNKITCSKECSKENSKIKNKMWIAENKKRISEYSKKYKQFKIDCLKQKCLNSHIL